MRRIQLYFKIFAFAPTINLILFLFLFFRAYFSIGRFPTYGNPDPKNFEFIYSLYILSWFLLVISLVLLPIFFFLVDKKVSYKLKYLLIYISVLFMILYLFRIESLGLGDWILD